MLRRQGVGVMLATNNATRPASAYVAKLAGFGVEVGETEILTSSLATAAVLRERLPPGSGIFARGGPGLDDALSGSGFQPHAAPDRPVAAVVVGLDPGLTYPKLCDACRWIRRGAEFLATNGDTTFPVEDELLPGAGALVAAVQAATGVAPTVIGKPEPAMFRIALAALGATAADCAVVGDRLDTDILGAERAGLPAILVTSGVDAGPRPGAPQPDVVVSGLPELVDLWTSSA
jgi:4-nitrophenyl phosphatase